MSAALQTGAEAFLTRFEGLRHLLPGDHAARDAAAASFRAAGLPGKRDESWKYTSLRALAETGFHAPLVPVAAGSALLARLPELDAPRAVFVDGRFRADLSVLPDRFAIRPLCRRTRVWRASP